jgi:hypothetical protein
VPALGLFGQITAMANRGYMVVVVKLNGESVVHLDEEEM